MTARQDGVVDPIRVPTAVEGRWRATPPLARAFLGLAVLDLLIALAERVGTLPLLDILPSMLGAGLADAAIVALPAVLLLRRPDARTATPLLVRGAILVALTTFLYPIARSLFAAVFGLAEVPSVLAAWTLITVADVAFAAAWLAIAVGLLRTERRRPGDVGIAASLLVGIVGVGVTLLSVGLQSAPNAYVVPEGLPVQGAMLVAWTPALSEGAFAVALAVAVRIAADPLRPRGARILAVVGAAARMLLLPVAYGMRLVPALGSSPVGMIVSFALGPWVSIAIVAAFALGLADPAEPAPEPPRRRGIPRRRPR